MRWVTRAARDQPRAAAARPSALADAFVDSWVAWREASEDVRAAYRSWNEAAIRHRGPAFEMYRAALDREQYAASVHSHWAQRVRAHCT